MFGVELWVILGLLTALGTGGYNTLQKYLVADESPLIVTLHSELFALPVLAVLALLASNPVPSPAVAGILVLSCACNAASFYLLARGLSLDDLSIVTPVRAVTPIIVALVEPLFLPAAYTLPVVGAAVCATVGIYVLLVEDDPLGPIRNYRRPGVLLGLGSALAVSGAMILDRAAVTGAGISAMAYPLYLSAGTAAILGTITYLRHGRSGLSTSIVYAPVGLSRVLLVAGGVVSLAHTTGTNLSVMSQLGVLLAVLFGGAFFDEEHLPLRLAGATLLIVATTVIILHG